MIKYVIYGKASCPYCMKIIKKLTEAKKTFYVELLDGNPERLKQMKVKYNHNTVPIVLVQKEEEILIGGCDDTIKHLEKEHEKTDL